MFANIDAVVESAERFCRDLQDVDLTGRVRDRNIGDVCLHHVSDSCNPFWNDVSSLKPPPHQLKNLRTLECYRTYYDRQDESQRSFQSMSKRPSFETFTEVSPMRTYSERKADATVPCITDGQVSDIRHWQHRHQGIVGGTGPKNTTLYAPMAKSVQATIQYECAADTDILNRHGRLHESS